MKSKFKTTLLFVTLSTINLFHHEIVIAQRVENNPQQLEQLVLKAESIHGKMHSRTGQSVESTGDKCGFALYFDITKYWTEFSESQKQRLRKILSPPVLQKDTIIGTFRIFYDSSGVNEPAMLGTDSNRIPNSYKQFVDSVGYYFNYVWNYFVNTLGYTPPPFQAGSNYYNVYIKELWDYNNPLYGETSWDPSDQIGSYLPRRFATYISIDNDYKDLHSIGIAGLKVTCAHELHHAFQLGSYGFLPNDLYFYEITSTWMEDVIFNDVNDYYQYLKSQNNNPRGQFYFPDVAFTSGYAGVTYSRAIWGKFVEKRFSRDVMRNSWENVRSGDKCLNAIDHALNMVGSDFKKAFLEWTIWNYNTGPDCDTVMYYTEGKNYPHIRLRPPVEYIKSERSINDSIEVLSTSYHPICLLNSPSDNCNSSPQMMAMISNVNMNSFTDGPFGYTFNLSPSNSSGSTQLSNGIYVRMDVPDPENWVSQQTIPIIVSEISVYPNPFYPKESKPIVFRLPPVKNSYANLYVFTASMDKVISKEMNIMSQSFEPFIEWDGHNSNGDIIASGIYFYLIEVDGNKRIGKFSVINK